MKSIHKVIPVFSFLFAPIALFLAFTALIMASGCSEPQSRLEYTGPGTGTGDTIYPDTPTGQQIKQHISVMAAVGEDAEANYQRSLAALRANPEVTSVLAEVYAAIPEEDYFRRTLMVETLKEMRSLDALPYLARIANEPVPEDRMPGNTEVNTREDEIVIRITAVQGLSILAMEESFEADSLLLELVSHDDMTVRQMASRGYLGSSVGNRDEKLNQLYERVPRGEHWYLNNGLTEIREVQHPDVLPDFDLDEFMKRQSDNSPRTGQNQEDEK